MTTPVKPEYSLLEWRSIARKAAAAAKADPSDYEAVEWRDRALRHIKALNVGANMADQNAGEPGALGSTIAALAHGAGLGSGEVFSGLGSAIAGKGFGEGAAEYREAIDAIEAAHPNLAATGEVAGSIALPGAKIGQGIGKAVQAGVPLGVRGTATLLGQGALTGAIPGAVSGFSAGGEDPGDMGTRLQQGGRGAIMGALIGSILTGAGIPLARRQVERAADLTAKGQQRRNVALRGEALEAQRDYLRQRGSPKPSVHPPSEGPLDDLAQAQADFAAGKISEEDFATAMEVAGGQMRGSPPVRATELPIRGEVQASAPALEPIPGTTRGFTAEGPPMPQGPFPPTIAELQRGITRPTVLEDPVAQQMARTGMGSPAKRGIGGHSYSGTYPKGTTVAAGAARTVPSPVGGPTGLAGKQLQAIQETLAKASPEEVPGVLQNLEAMGILTKQQVAEVLASVPPARGSLPVSGELAGGFGIQESRFPNSAWEIIDPTGQMIKRFRTEADFRRWRAKNPFEPDPSRMGVFVPKVKS